MTETRRPTYTFIRHGESLFNKYKASGRDPELTDDGRICAAELSGNYDYALVSCMRRARETFLYAPNLTANAIEYSSLCREIISNGASKPNLMEGEENIEEDDEAFAFRMQLLKEFLRHKAEKYGTILVVCHYKVIKALTYGRAANCQAFSVDELD